MLTNKSIVELIPSDKWAEIIAERTRNPSPALKKAFDGFIKDYRNTIINSIELDSIPGESKPHCKCISTHTYQRIDAKSWRCDKCGLLADADESIEMEKDYAK